MAKPASLELPNAPEQRAIFPKNPFRERKNRDGMKNRETCVKEHVNFVERQHSPSEVEDLEDDPARLKFEGPMDEHTWRMCLAREFTPPSSPISMTERARLRDQFYAACNVPNDAEQLCLDMKQLNIQFPSPTSDFEDSLPGLCSTESDTESDMDLACICNALHKDDCSCETLITETNIA